MNAKAKKLLKILAWIVGIVVGLPLLLLLTVPLWLGPIFRPSLNAFMPRFTKTAFNIEHLHLNPYTCNFELAGVTIGNPEGFSDPTLAKIGCFNVDVDADTVFSDVIVIDDVEVSDVYITWLDNKEGKNNLDIVQQNILGAEDEYEKELEKERKRIAEEERRAGMSEAEIKAEEEASKINKKIIVNRFVFRNVSGKISVPKLGVMPFRVPSIELKDIGRKAGGLDLDNLRDAVMKEFWIRVMASSSNFAGMIGQHFGKALDMIKGVKDSESLKKAGDALKDAGNAIKGLFGK